MSSSERADRLRIDTRLAVLENVKALSRQLDAALQASKMKEAKAIQKSISALLKQLDELSRLSLSLLEDSPAVKEAIKSLRHTAADLEDEAETITKVADALEKGAEIVSRATGLINRIRKLIPA